VAFGFARPKVAHIFSSIKSSCSSNLIALTIQAQSHTLVIPPLRIITMKKYGSLPLLALLLACSPIMEANRPDPVDMTQFAVGEKRMNVLAAVGAPLGTTKDGDNSCDIYKLYTEGHSGAGKGAIAAGEVVADVFTLGLTEIIFTPAEGATQDSKHAVIFCYSSDDKLVSINHSEGSAGSD
jgi:hypothetical protein